MVHHLKLVPQSTEVRFFYSLTHLLVSVCVGHGQLKIVKDCPEVLTACYDEYNILSVQTDNVT